MRWKDKKQILQIVKEHPGLLMVEITAIAYPELVDSSMWGWAKQDVAHRLQVLKTQKLVRPIYQVTNQMNAGHRWEAVE